MRFLSNFGYKIFLCAPSIFGISKIPTHFLEEALITWPLSASDLSVLNVSNSFLNIIFLVPSAAPVSLKGWNISSTGLQLQWSPIPVEKHNGKLLGYQVVVTSKQQKMEWNLTVNYTTKTSLKLNGLKKYSVYVVSVYGVTRRGRGPAGVITVRTDEDGKITTTTTTTTTNNNNNNNNISPRRHPSSSRVYFGNNLQLKNAVSIPEQISIF